MMTAQRLLPSSSVGVAPGTTTVALSGPWNYQDCDNNPARVAFQRMRMFPPGKYPAATPEADQRAQRWRGWSPYATLENLRGFGRGLGRGLGRALGIVVTPFEYTQAGKNRNYCTSAPGLGPDYAGPGGTLMGSTWGRPCIGWKPGMGSPSQLGAIPTDFDLSKRDGNMPMMHQWIPFKDGTWTTPPFIQPDGNWDSNSLINRGIWAPPLAGPQASLGAAVDQASAGLTPMDPATAALLELKRHQDRMWLLGIISAGAVVSTALINVFRYSWDARTHKRGGRVAAEPNPVISGGKRRNRRR